MMSESLHDELYRIAALRQVWGDVDGHIKAQKRTVFLLTCQAPDDLKQLLSEGGFYLCPELNEWVFMFPTPEIFSHSSAIASLGQLLYALSGIPTVHISALFPDGDWHQWHVHQGTNGPQVYWEV